MKLRNIVFLFLIVIMSIARTQIIEVSGEQSGIWESENVYQVVGDISVISGYTLIIEPGTIVEFMDLFEMNITGILLAEGTMEDSILFTSGQAEPQEEQWKYLTFEYSQSSASVISHCIIEYAITPVFCTNNASIQIHNNLIRNCGHGIYSNGSVPAIEDNVFTQIGTGVISINQISVPIRICGNYIFNPMGNGIYIDEVSSIIVENNFIQVQGYGVYCYMSEATVKDNIIIGGTKGFHCYDSEISIIHNQIRNCEDGIYSTAISSPSIKSNTIVNCLRGIKLEGNNENVVVQNNIFYDNSTALNIVQPDFLMLSNNLFWENNIYSQGYMTPGLGEIITTNFNGDPCDIFNNLFLDPCFIDPENFDYHLNADSPAINAGLDDYDFTDPDGTIADMGAYYYQLYPETAQASFRAHTLFGSHPLQVQFINLSSGDIDSYFWDFGDGSVSYDVEPLHEFTENGLYSITLTVSGTGGTDTCLLNDYIDVMPQVDVTGSVMGTWSAQNSYRISGDIQVDEGEHLVIEPGTTIRFMGYYTFTVSGTLMAEGTEEDSILFISGLLNPAKNSWDRIAFIGDSSSGSRIDYAVVKYGDWGIYCENSAPEISHSQISYHTYGFVLDCGSPEITFNNISYNSMRGIECWGNGNAIISNNTFKYNLTCISMGGPASHHLITENLFVDNRGSTITAHSNSLGNIEISWNIIRNNHSGISLYHSGCNIHHNFFESGEDNAVYLRDSPNTVIYNNNICNMECGIYCFNDTNIEIMNNIFYGDETAIYSYYLNESVEYNLFYQNVVDYEGDSMFWFGILNYQNYNDDPCDMNNNIFMSPGFVDAEIMDYHLLENSNCVDAGNPDPAYNDPDCTISDIGAFYYQLVVDNGDENIPDSGFSLTNYPNPFNPSTTIEFYVPKSGECSLSIYNIKGERIRSFKIQNLKFKINSVVWDGKDDSGRSVGSGIYFCRLKQGSYSKTQKMILLK